MFCIPWSLCTWSGIRVSIFGGGRFGIGVLVQKVRELLACPRCASLTKVALRDYEPRVSRYTDQLLAQLETSQGKPINMTTWFNFYSFDVMGDLAFGKSFGMLQEGVVHYFMKSLHADMTNIGLFSHMLWLFPLFKATPILNYEHKRFWKWVNAQVDGRRKVRWSRTSPSSIMTDRILLPRTSLMCLMCSRGFSKTMKPAERHLRKMN